MAKSERNILSRFNGSKFHAGPKAKRDIEDILQESYGFTPVFFDAGTSLPARVMAGIRRIYDVYRTSRQSDLLVVQWPYSDKQLYTRTIHNPVTWIHDIDYIRLQKEALKNFELDFFNRSRLVVVHNEVMAAELMREGIDPTRIIVLELFDYLAKGDVPDQGPMHEVPQIVYTGNLDKSQFLWQLSPSSMSYDLHVYGTLEKKLSSPPIHYHGALPPDEVPNTISGDLGLVWDGDQDAGDAQSPSKNYTRYNNPHKLSCYIAAGLPVIVWSQSAAARLVSRYNIGYTIDSLADINALDFSDYEEKRKNTIELGKKVRSGFFTRRAMDEVLHRLKKD